MGMLDHCLGDADRFRKYTDAQTFARIVDDGDLCQMWKRCATEYEGRVALTYAGSSLTYGELDREIAARRSALAKAGCKSGERIALVCANSIDFACAFFAIVTLGGVAVVLPPQYSDQEIEDCCRRMEATKLLAQPELQEMCEPLCERISGLAVLSTDRRAEADVPMFLPQPDDPCVIMLTGGTTGRRKGALLSHTAMVRGIMNGCYCAKEPFEQRYLLLLPLSHTFGLIRNLLTSIYTGSTMFISESPKNMVQDMLAFNPTILVVVPALVELALKLYKTLGRNIFGTSLKTIISGAAPMPSYLIEEYHLLGVTILPGYGLTEAANLVSGNGEPLSKPDSIGLLYPELELKIVDGELWLKGRNLLTCYVGGDEEGLTEDGWFRTGDLVQLDEDGFLYMTGRTKEIIKLDNGVSIYPVQLEAHFNALSFVQDSEVFEAVEEDGRHVLALEVVLRETELEQLGADPAQAALERLWDTNRQQDPSEQVSRITVRDRDFERTPSMKIVRHKL